MVTLSAPVSRDRTSTVVLLISLALNLFFLGLVAAGPVRHLLVHSPPAAIEPSKTAAERIERLAATLPAADAEKLRAEFRANETTLEAAHAAYRNAQQMVRAALRAEPFEVSGLRAAMAQTRSARQTLDAALQSVIASAAAQMSMAGRRRLADFSPPVHNAPSAAH